VIKLSHSTKRLVGEINLPSSKSISNRMLMLQKMYEPRLELDNISEANDTVVLGKLLQNGLHEVDAEDAGAVFRFMVAYCSCTPGTWRVYGTPRLNERPISELVDVLLSLGADIKYENESGKAPLLITGKKLRATKKQYDLTNVKSSQFISALLLIAPKVEGDFVLKINQKMRSYSYVKLTISCLRRMGFSVYLKGSYIQVNKNQKFDGEYFLVEPDWTSFYYWFSMIYLSESSDLFFPGLRLDNMQRERKLLFQIGAKSVSFQEQDGGLHFQKQGSGKIECPLELNFSQYPDSAMTYAILISALQCNTSFRGLESLKYKECDREQALTSHLKKLGVQMTYENKKWGLDSSGFKLKENSIFESYDDHRMIMCAASLALIAPIQLDNPAVVRKSYPRFWEDLKAAGFAIENE
jgi:3-phosphoshikimate 1-carboxyvinyltransferase